MMTSDFVAPAATAPGVSRGDAVPWWGRLSLLWLGFVPLCALLYTLCLPIGPNDFWYHARAGRAIAATGHIPQINGFTHGVAPSTPYFYQSWIADWLLFQLLRVGGLSGVIIARSMLMSLSFALVALAGYRRCRRLASEGDDSLAARLAALGTLLAFLMTANNLDTRPQMFSVPLFCGCVAALWEWPFASPRFRWIMGLTLPLLMAVWANTHGAFCVGLLLLGVTFGGEAFWALWQRQTQLSKSGLVGLGLLLAGCVVGAMLNQKGAGIYQYALQLGRNDIGQRFIAEWQAPKLSLEEWHNIVFFASPLLLACALAARRVASANFASPCGVRPGEAMVLLVFFAMGCRDVRAIIWYGLAFAPVFAACVMRALIERRRAPAPPIPAPPRAVQVMNAVLAGLLLLGCVPVLPAFKADLPLPPAFAARFAPTPKGDFPWGFASDPPLLLERGTPVEAAVWLRAHPPQGKLWNDMVFGSYLMWALPSTIKPLCDPRVELYPTAFWEDYGRLCLGPPDAARTLAGRGFSDALLDTKLQAGLARRLTASPDWHAAFRSKGLVLFRRT